MNLFLNLGLGGGELYSLRAALYCTETRWMYSWLSSPLSFWLLPTMQKTIAQEMPLWDGCSASYMQVSKSFSFLIYSIFQKMAENFNAFVSFLH